MRWGLDSAPRNDLHCDSSNAVPHQERSVKGLAEQIQQALVDLETGAPDA